MRGRDDIRVVGLIATRQYGNVTTGQLRATGWSDGQIERRCAAGWLIRRHRGVYAVGHVPDDRRSEWMAAVLALGPGAVLSHRPAGAHWTIVPGAVPLEVIAPSRAGHPFRDSVVVHRIPLLPQHVTVRDGIPVTTLLRTVLDLATVYDGKWLREAFDEAQVQHRLPPEVVAAEALCRAGYRGNGRIRRLLVGAVDPDRVRSILELRFLRMCVARDLPLPVVNEKVGAWRPDFLWPEAGLVVETDGDRFHRLPSRRRRDAEKDAALRAAGLRVVRLTWSDVTERPERTAHAIRTALLPTPPGRECHLDPA
jgi:hypothetical protein